MTIEKVVSSLTHVRDDGQIVPIYPIGVAPRGWTEIDHGLYFRRLEDPDGKCWLLTAPLFDNATVESLPDSWRGLRSPF